MQHFQLYPDIRVKHLGMEPYFWDFLSILKFVPNIWGVETYFWEMCTTQRFSFYPDIHRNHLGGSGLRHISVMCAKPIAKI